VLVLFLRGLTDGIVTRELWDRIEGLELGSLAASGGGTVKGMMGNESAEEGDKAAVLDVLAAAPNHNISFVFLTAMLGKIAGELAPLGRGEVEALKAVAAGGGEGNPAVTAVTAVGGVVGGVLGRRSLSFRKSIGAAGGNSNTPKVVQAMAALEKRVARERRYASVFGDVVCRPRTVPERGKERKAVEDKMRGVVELFLRRRGDA